MELPVFVQGFIKLFSEERKKKGILSNIRQGAVSAEPHSANKNRRNDNDNLLAKGLKTPLALSAAEL